MKECPNCDPFDTMHFYHCHKCLQGFETMQTVCKHAWQHIALEKLEKAIHQLKEQVILIRA